jgi:hypothetical protein
MAALPPNDPNNNPHLQNEISNAVMRFEAGGQTEKAARIESHARRCGTPEPIAKYSFPTAAVPLGRVNAWVAPGGDARRYSYTDPSGMVEDSYMGPSGILGNLFLGPGPYKN